MSEALWPLGQSARGAQAPAGQDDATGDEQRKRADAVISKCAGTGTAQALQLLMSPGVAPASARTVELARKAVCRHEGRPLPPRSWVSDYIGRAAAPDVRVLVRTLKRGGRGGAQDLGGWRYEYLQLALLRPSALDALHGFLSCLARSQC
eukprot:5803329-Karenia_brevis.AAC.1